MKAEATLKSRARKRQGNVNLHEMWRADLSVEEINAIDAVTAAGSSRAR